MFNPFVFLYSLFARARTVWLCVFAGLFIFCALFVSRQQLSEDISLFLPDYNQALLERYAAFQHSPVARMVFFTLDLKADVDPDKAAELFSQGASVLRQGLPSEFFARLYPENIIPNPSALLRLVPNLLAGGNGGTASLEWLESKVVPEVMRSRLEELKLRLSGPEAVLLKHFVRVDPLGFMSLLPQRLAASGFLGSPPAHSPGNVTGGSAGNGSGDVTGDVSGKPPVTDLSWGLDGSGLPSRTGKGRMFLAESMEKLTERQVAFAIEAAVENIRAKLPEGLSVTALSPHAHTVANVRVVEKDSALVLGVSLSALLLGFILYLRRVSALPVLLLPCAALVGSAGIMLLCGFKLSGITLGFGAVLLGIVTDYGLYVYCAYEERPDPARLPGLIRQISPSLFFAFATTGGIFVVLLSSGLPGVRQVSVFSLIGLSIGLFMAICVLPLILSFFKPRQVSPGICDTPASSPERSPGTSPETSPVASIASCALPHQRFKVSLKPWPCVLFLVALAICFLPVRNIKLNGELRALGVQDRKIVEAEDYIRQNWGQNTRSFAMLVAGSQNVKAADGSEGIIKPGEPGESGRTGEIDKTGVALNRLSAALRLLPESVRKESRSPLSFIPDREEQSASRRIWNEFRQKHPDLPEQVSSLAKSQGYSASAFNSFRDFYQAEPTPITRQSLEEAGLGIVNTLFLPSGRAGSGSGAVSEGPGALSQEQYALALLPDVPELLDIKNFPEGVLLLSPMQVANDINSAVSADFTRLGYVAFFVVLGLLSLLFRKPIDIFIASVPMLTALGCIVLCLGLWGRPLNLFAVCVLPLVLGLCADYGIFMLHCLKGKLGHCTRKSIFLSGLSTLSGFASLLLADHPALFSLGLTVSLGLLVAIPATLWLVPRLVNQSLLSGASS